jgi:hypothetical protein
VVPVAAVQKEANKNAAIMILHPLDHNYAIIHTLLIKKVVEWPQYQV